MKCPACGNDELQEHHRFCCNCGCSLAGVRSAGETLAGSTPDSTQRPPSNTADQRATTSNSDTSVRNENSFASEEHPHDANQRPESDKSSRVDSEKHESKKDGFVVGSQDDRCTSEDVTTGSRPISNLNSDLQQVSPNTGIDAKAPDRLDEVGLTTIQYNGEDVKKEQTGLQEDVKKEQTGLQEDVKNEQTGLQKFVKKEQTGLQENVRKEQTGLQEVAKKEQTGLQEDVKKEQTGLQEVAKKEQTGLQEVVKKEQTGLQEVVKNEQTGLQEVVKKEQTGLQEVAKKEQTGLQEDVKKEQTGLQEDVKNEQTGLQEDVKEEQTGLQEDVKKEQTGLQEDVKKEQTGLQEDVKKEQTGLQEDVKKEQTDLQEDVKKEQTDLQEDVKKKQTGQEDAKNEQTGLQEDVKKELTGLQEDVKKELTGLQEDVKKEQTGREDVKKEQTGLQEDVKKEQTGLQEVVKKEQTGLQEDVKKEQTGLQEDVKKELTGLQEDVKKEQTGLQEDVKKEQTGLQEDVKKEQTGLQEDVKKEQTGLQEDVKKEQTGREDVKKEQTGQQEDVKKEQTGLQEVAKKEQTGLQEDVKKEQTGLQEDVKKELTGLQEDVKKEQTALQEDVKKEQTGLQEDVKKEHTGREDVKKEQTGQQEDVKKEQTGLQEVAKKEQTGLQEDVKKEQTGLQEDVKKEQTGREDTKEEKKGQEDVKKAQMGQEHVNEKQTGLEDAKEKQTGQVDTKGKQAGKEDAKKNQKDQEHAEEKHTDQEDAKGNQSGQEDVKNKLTSQKDAKERQTGKDDAKEQTIQENAKEKQTDQEDGKERAGQEDTKKKQKGQEDTTKEQKGEDDAKEKQIDPENTKTERTDQEGAKKGQKDQFGFVTVVFHALLTPTFQFNPKQGDRLYIRGGLPFSWREQNQLTVHVVRDVFNGYMELEGKIKITLKQASGRIAYKYVVVRPQGFYNPPKNFWECLIGFKPRVNGHVNRCLHIREDSLKDGATWHQYDDALFSEPGLWESICSHFPLLRTVRLDPAEGRRMAMLVMLPDWDRISCDQGAISGSSALTIINDIVYCLSKPEVENGGYFFDRILTNFNFREVLYEYLSPRLNLNTQIQQTQATEDVQVKRLVTSVIIASLSVRHEMTFLTEIELRNLLENLTMQGNVEIQGLIKHFPKEYHQRTLTDFMQRLCNYVIEHRFGMVYWLFAVPLLHFLSKSSSPFGQKELTPAPSSVKDDLWWGTEDLNLRRAREGASALRKSPALLLNQLMPMFELDPLFERTFLLALPIGDISKVLKKRKFSLHEVCWTLNRVVVDRHTPFLNDDEWDCLEDCVKEMNDDAEKYDRVLSISQWEEMISLAKAASQLLQHLLKQYQLAIQKRSVLFCGVLALLGKSLLLAKRGSSMFQSESKPFAERPEEGMNMFKEAFVCLRESLKKQFGRTLLDASEEFQFWSHLLLVNFEDKEMQQYFQTGIKELLQSRITEVDHRHVVELFCTLDLSTYHQDVGDCVMSAAFKAIEYLLKSENKDEHVATLSSRFDSAKLTHWQASGVSKLFGLLLERHWPGGRDRAGNTSQIEILRHIFSWKPMAQYFEYFSHSQGGVVLPDDSMVILSSASSLLEDVGRRLKNAEIDVKTLRIVQKNREEFLKLHYLLSEVDESQSSNDVQTAENKLSEAGEKQKGARTMELFLEMRIEELKAFEKERDAVFFFVEQCSVIKSVEIDLNEINVKLKKDLDSCRLHELCHKRTTSEEPIVKFFEMSQNNRRMIQSFHLVRSSLLFLSFWQKCVQKAAELCRDEYGLTEVLNIDKVFESLWKPSIQRWRGMWERILSGEISLKEVEDRFGRFRNNSESLDAEIEVVLKFFRDEEDIDGDLRRAVAQIKQFQKLTECEDAAAAILDFQQAMKLKGDFQVLDDFRDQMNEDFRRRPLGSIDDDVLEMGKALERLTRPMIDCLRTVIDCKEYIFWLREEVQGREEVKTLVDLAMMSAGESDIETDRVSCLHTTALSFAPFIFDLDKCAGLNDLMAICEGVSEEIEENGNLPEKLRDISRHLEWLKGVKDAHAMSSLKLAQAINERGVYCIGQSENVTSTTPSSDKKSIDSVISLLLLPTTADGEQKVFSLEKLQELQSKLALISGKGSQGQDDVEKFSQLLQGVCQLGKAYVSLCEIGDVSHLDWREEYKCKSKVGHNVIVEIQSKSKEFEERFKACKEHINVMRMKYHELNYFTIQQLVFLRKQLAGLKHSSTMSLLNLQVYALLEKVLPGLHHSSLQDTLLDAGILLSHLNQDVYSEDVGSSNTCDLMSLTSAERDGRCTDDQQIVEKYEQLLNNLEKLNYFEPERLAVAALVSNSESTEVECVLWCVNNNANGDLIDELYDRAKGDPMFCGIVKQVAESDEESLQSSEDLEEGHKSSTEGSDNEELDGSIPEEITLDETKGGIYLSLDEIGVFLSRLASNGGGDVRRRFPSFLKKGRPNLILAPKEYIFASVLGLYMDEGAQCLPNSEEVLICTPETTSEEVELLWRRALENDEGKLHCLVNGDLLDYDVSQKAVDCLHTLMQDYPSNEDLALVVLCSSENEERAHIVTSLEQFKVEGIPRYSRPDELRRYLQRQFKSPHQRPGSYRDQHVIWSAAADVARAENLNVRVVKSEHPGVGKSLVVQRLAEQVSNLPNNLQIKEIIESQSEEPPPLCVTIPFHDKNARITDVVSSFLPHALSSEVPLSRIFHLDRSSTVTPEFETLLFNLLILGELTDDRGHVWRRNPYDLYILEITDPAPKGAHETTKTCKFHELLPSINCFRPSDSLFLLRRKGEVQTNSSPLFDEEELQNEPVQRVWQYLQLFNEDPQLIQELEFDPGSARCDSPAECLETLIRNCGVRNPSWSELRYFVNFLNYQLRDCENSAYCDASMTDDTLEGFRSFVVAFMIIMSKDFSMRSLEESDSLLNEQQAAGVHDEERDIAPFQLRRQWEKSPHPYIFFNPDHTTMTFLGFRVDPDGNLLVLDPRTGQIIQERLMSRHLRTGLHVQGVDLNNSFESYSKAEKIGLLSSVMGLEFGYDPDESYELTGDNVKKILAIHMRFRCNIPVVIMGETGCGKTRLIRYLCGLQTEGQWKDLKNMLLMKIHGGTTYKDIERNVLHAEAMALQNEQHKEHVDTVLFFDEANTTDALGMIKEVMVDRRCNGRPLSDRVKFIVACNPYRRHSKEMIRKLESAGLGYHVRADETEERLGQIPLRHLVYRVHAIPGSMRSLVWDFGQLSPEVEELYTRQIVGRYVQQKRLPGGEELVIAIATVLAASQQFMRNKEDECSFVSLRDVKRAMEVMVWFYENFEKFSALIQDEDNDEGKESDDRKQDMDEFEEELSIFKPEHAAFKDEDRPVKKQQPTFAEDRPILKREPRSLITNIEELPTFEKERSSQVFRPARKVHFKEQPTLETERAAPKLNLPTFEERHALKEERPTLQKVRIPFKDERPALPRGVGYAQQAEMYLPELEELDFEPRLVEELQGDAMQGNLSDVIDPVTWSLILALGVCYQARLRDRNEYRETVAKSFRHPCRLPGGAARIEREISRCQQALMAQLELGPNIARNTALSENVFMMVVCIELRIPLFVVGKPGSSKSLAKTVVADNMQGDNSKSNLFKTFKQIQLVSYQCSPQSTPEGILATFRQCSELQKGKNTERTSDRFASVVVLDEVGLAEDSPKMPLKALHPLLEDEDQNDDEIIQTEDSFTRVAFIGLSNWALDPAKMNRGIMLCRNEPDDDELEATARGICGGDEDVMTLIEPLISPLVRGYTELYNKQKHLQKLQDGKKDEFFGLRDFYSLLKMVVHIAKEQRRRPNWDELERAIKRNFSGLLEEDFNPVQILMRNLGFPPEYFQVEEDHQGEDSLNLIRESLKRKGGMGEGRYLLIMTENFAALPRVKQLLIEEDSEEPYVIFGSGFPKDQLFTQVCRNINRVKICMETGRTVILLNLENLYESLYDALNQYYVTFGGEKYVDLGLGNNRVKCRVHKDFRLIVIAEKDVVYNKFPIPLINRLEKHFLVMSSGLTEPQKHLTRRLKEWVDDFAEVFQPAHERPKRTFKTGDAFIGYQEDSVSAVVLQVCAELRDDGSVLSSDEDRQSWEDNVLRCCQERLLQCATPDSVTRLHKSRLSSQAGDLWTTYFREQEHSSLANFLDKALNDAKLRATDNTKTAMRVQISTHSRLLSDRDIPNIAAAVELPEGCVKCVSLKQFQTEQQFCNCIGRDFWARLGGRESLLIVQCDSADQSLGLLACARHLLVEECREMEKELDPDSTGPSHILMIVQLSRVAGGCSDFVGVQLDDWKSIHIDELCPPSEEMPPIEALMGRSVSKIFESALQKEESALTVCQVLASCVQEAASRIEDDESTLGRATRRIELLVKLLSKNTTSDDDRFEMVLAKRLCELLQEKDQRAVNEGNEWLQSEAMSRTVHETGTFKKALWRRFQSVVAPILAEVIAYVDRDGNLELAASEDDWVFNLWLRIFGDSSLSELSYEFFHEGDVPVVRNKVPVSKSGYRSHAFQCRFPFSWILKERIDELYREARSIAANSHESVTECLRRLLNNSEVKSIVSEAIDEGGQEAVVACYLYDFVHMVYKPHDEDEIEVVQKAITAAAKEIHNSVQTPGESFAMDFALVHVAHSRIQQRLNCLSLLLQAKPDIMPDLRNRFSWDENEMTVDAMALQMCLERMEPCAEDVEDTSRRQTWCDQVLSVKVPVEETISKSSTGDSPRVGEKTELIITQCRCMWQRLSAVRMFIEHACPSQMELDPQDVQNILRLWKALGDRTDFSKAESLITVERFLVSCSEDSIQRLQEDKPEDHQAFLHRCNAFFMDIVSVFCFGEDVRFLDPGVFEMLMRFVTGKHSTHETREFSPFPEFGADSSPVVRSFLLQQLVNSSDETAKKHLERFLYEAQGLSSEVPHILNVCLLAVQCMENSLASTLAKNANLELQISIGIITKLCQDALQILTKDFSSSDELQVESLDAIAKARYVLGIVAEFMYLSCVSDDEKWKRHEICASLELLFVKVKALCTSSDHRSPALYLLKQLVKRFGGHSISAVSQNEELSWIVPAEFLQREGDGMNLDRFLVYGELYRKVRDCLARAILSENTDELIATLEALREIPGHARDIVVLLALYREVAVAQNQLLHQNKYVPIKDVVLKRGRFLSTNARHFAKDLLKDSHGLGSPFFLGVQETQSGIVQALPEILFHVATVLRCTEFDEMLEPLRRIMLSPGHVMGSFLPTMPEDSFSEVSLSMSEGGNWYECPAGHRYFVGDCGRPDQTRDCPSCESGVEIGGEKHNLIRTNRLATRQDRSNTGHILGAPQRTIAERDLSPANVSLLRVILHSAMLVGSYQQPEVISQLMQPQIQAEDVCGFLWEHLINDVRNVSTSLERSEDEVLLMIHHVLSEIMSRSTARGLDFSEKWSTKTGRKEWENEFVKVFARHVCTNLEERLRSFYSLSVNDRRLGNDPLMREIYEVDTPPPTRTAADIHPGHAAFWKYRTRVTVEHVIRQFQDVKSNRASCKVLEKFLAEEQSLRAVRYLHDILALQRILTDRFHRRIDRDRANQIKIRELLQEFPRGQKENITKLFRSFSAAWEQVRLQLSSQGRFAPTKEQCSLPIDQNSTVSVLLPTDDGAGVCCKGLLFFLVNKHNELVQAYSNSVNSNGNAARKAGNIPLSEVSISQLVAYDSEKDLLPVMLANCSYSLEVGKETQLQYNWEALEKQIVDRFIRGRPLVDFEVDNFLFREDARDDFAFDRLRSKIPQESIPGPIRTQILSELKDLRNVCDLLSTLEMAIGFLSTAGGDPEMKIHDYFKTILLITDGKSNLKSKKAQQSCSLNHILDLWCTLAIARAKLLIDNRQDPFEKVPEVFKTEMTRHITTHFSAALKKEVNIELFLSKVIEVISLWLDHEDEQTGEMGLGEYLSTYSDDYPDADKIPEDVCVKHVIQAWQLALENRERDQGRRRSMIS